MKIEINLDKKVVRSTNIDKHYYVIEAIMVEMVKADLVDEVPVEVFCALGEFDTKKGIFTDDLEDCFDSLAVRFTFHHDPEDKELIQITVDLSSEF